MAQPMIGIAVYVCTTDRSRTKKYPFAAHMEAPRRIEEHGLVYELVARHYEVDPVAIAETQERVREWNAKHFGRQRDRQQLVQDVIAHDTATAGEIEEAA